MYAYLDTHYSEIIYALIDHKHNPEMDNLLNCATA